MRTQIRNDLNLCMDIELTKNGALLLWIILNTIIWAYFSPYAVLTVHVVEILRWFKSHWRIEIKGVNE